MASEVTKARATLKHGNAFPYDAGDQWWNGDGTNPPKPTDWAHSAARGVIADLSDRRGIKNVLSGLDEETKAEIVRSLATIIRTAKEQQ